MRLFITLLLLAASLSAECVLIMTKNVQISRQYAEVFSKEGFDTKMIATISPKVSLKDDGAALSIVRKSGCEYALFMPISIKSRNIDGVMDIKGRIKLYRQDKSRFKTITWSDESEEEIIDLQDRDARTKIQLRFVRLTSSKAIEYFRQR